jgi:hypothetical protein
VKALYRALVSLTGCTVADCLEGNDLEDKDKGMRLETKKTIFKGNFKGLEVVGPASVLLDMCMTTSNNDSNVTASLRAVVDLVGCTVAD